MGMNAFSMQMITKVLEQIPHRPAKMVSLGHPDILLTAEVLESVLGKQGAQDVAIRPDSESILRWHGMTEFMDKVPVAHDFFGRLGIELSITDFREVRGDELICDLNQPMAKEYYNQFDIVFDGGTLEHCFNVAQGVINILGMAKVNGFIIHANPLVLINHGFYNFSPTFYYDFYGQNGHSLASQIFSTKNVGPDTKIQAIHPTTMIRDLQIETGVAVVAQKRNDNPPIYPTQSKYIAVPDLKAN